MPWAVMAGGHTGCTTPIDRGMIRINGNSQESTILRDFPEWQIRHQAERRRSFKDSHGRGLNLMLKLRSNRTMIFDDLLELEMAVCQNLVPLVNIKIAGKWMFIHVHPTKNGINRY